MKRQGFYIVGSLMLGLFLILAVLVKLNYTHGPIPGIDPGIQKFAAALQNQAWLVSIATIIAKFLGDAGGLIVGVLIIGGLYFGFKQRAAAIWLAINIFIAVVGNTLIKLIVGRIRPETYRLASFAHEPGNSFASGHSVFATVLFLALLMIAWPYLKTSTQRVLASGLTAGLILLTMFSRVLLGVHYPSDTIGGFILAVGVLMLTYPTFIRYQARLK
ncbi:membrane-associated phospholipid phosphatase [Weissella oryzae SG25]|uniref:Membrane-associated phospholipid phosphatase n=1 Tax=Weissella oryzae (strain DSM 25784 / JCM 18191 / LMG 30913 / SG25) TaxID=1329250 RepID=A0A069CT40_WEIOS|nr:phosphatase PAP2 family protein [Weissella oryzae]GAK30985.1 membrane-associated phospholipid phosphatase [Weissella oryzae SG25]